LPVNGWYREKQPLKSEVSEIALASGWYAPKSSHSPELY
jgi:hypothetical protein